MAGYPDYQKIVQWTGAAFYSGANVVYAAAPVSAGPFQMQTFSAVMLQVQTFTPGAIEVTLAWSNPGNLASLAVNAQYQLGGATGNTLIVPAYGNVLVNVLLKSSQSANVTASVSILPTNLPPGSGSPYPNGKILQATGPLAAGGTQTGPPDVLYAGAAQIALTMNQTPWHLVIEALDRAGAVVDTVLAYNGTVGRATIPVALPAQVWRYSITNDSAAAAVFTLGITPAQPSIGG